MIMIFILQKDLFLGSKIAKFKKNVFVQKPSIINLRPEIAILVQ